MARTKQQYFSMGHADAQTTPANRQRHLYDATSWQGRAYREGYNVGEMAHEAAQAPAVQSIAPTTHERAGFRLGDGVVTLDGQVIGTAKAAYVEFANSVPAQRRADRIQALKRGYIAAMLWTTTDDDNNACDDMEVTPDGHAEILAIVTAFYDRHTADLGAYVDLRIAEVGSTYHRTHDRQTEAYGFAGHDLWLTSQGHGVGFWDRGHGRVGERLTKAAKAFEGCDAYTTDDGYVDLSVPFHASWKKV